MKFDLVDDADVMRQADRLSDLSHPHPTKRTKSWDESKHPRGQPDNAGQFASSPGGGTATAEGDEVRIGGSKYWAERVDSDDAFPPAIASYELKDGHVFYTGRNGSEGVVTGTPDEIAKWMSDVRKEVKANPPEGNKHRSWNESDGGKDRIDAAKQASANTARLFGIDAPRVEFTVAEKPLELGEHGGEKLTVANAHTGDQYPLAFGDVDQGAHVAAHETMHAVYGKHTERAQQAMKELEASGKSVSMYGGIAGSFEGLMELGAAYSHSPDKLKQHDPELYGIIDRMSKYILGKGSVSDIDSLEMAHDKASTVERGVLPSKAEMNTTRAALMNGLKKAIDKSMPGDEKKMVERLKELQREDYEQNGVRAQSFKSWFGDWEKKEGSKVVDEQYRPQKTASFSHVVDDDGQPQIVYHGTTHEFSEFRPGSVENFWGNGHYFTTSMDDVSRHYANPYGGDRMLRVSAIEDTLMSPCEEAASRFGSWLEESGIDFSEGLSGSEENDIRSELSSILTDVPYSKLLDEDAFADRLIDRLKMDKGEFGTWSSEFNSLPHELAKPAVIGKTPQTLECYLNIRNPVVFDGKSGTQFHVETSYSSDDTIDTIGQMRQSFVDAAKAHNVPQASIDQMLSSIGHTSPDETYNDAWKAVDLFHGDLGDATSPSDLTDGMSEMLDKWRDEASMELTGSGHDLAEAMREVGAEYVDDTGDAIDIEKVIEEIGLNEPDSSISAEQVIQRWRSMDSQPLMYQYHDFDSGDMKTAGGQFWQDVFRKLGYDGIKDMEVSRRFTGMNLGGDTVHWVAFDPTQIKSTKNEGTFDRQHLSIYKSLPPK